MVVTNRMQSAHEIHVDLVRLLASTERLFLTGEPSAEDGGWEYWPRFCQVISVLISGSEICGVLTQRLLYLAQAPGRWFAFASLSMVHAVARFFVSAWTAFVF